jgi:hypothetical protein
MNKKKLNVSLAFKCDVCSMQFQDKIHLQRHKKVHARNQKSSGVYHIALNPDAASLSALNSAMNSSKL